MVNKTKLECVKYNNIIKYADYKLDLDALGVECSIKSNSLTCDQGKDKDGNGDGFCDSGETCFYFNLTDTIDIDKISNGEEYINKKDKIIKEVLTLQ